MVFSIMAFNEKKIVVSTLLLNRPVKLKWVMTLLAVLLAMVFWYFTSCAKGNATSAALPEKIKETYVAVLPFKNNTGKPEMDVIGEMAADWITSGLHETGEGKILSVGEVNSIIESNRPQQSSLDNSIAQQANVHYLIEGAYYEMDNALMFSSNVKDLSNGEIVFSFPIIEGTVDDPLGSIEALKQRILGYWVTKDRAGYERRPPVYEAYQAYLEASKIWYDNPDMAKVLMKKASELDTNFHYATFSYIHKLISSPEKAKADSMVTAFQNKKGQLNRMELEFLNGLQGRLTKNFDQLWKHWNSPYMEAYWGKTFVIKQKVSMLLGYFNQPQKALELLQEVDFASLDYDSAPHAKKLYIRKIEALSRSNKVEEATEMWQNIPFDIRNSHTVFNKIFGLAQLKAYHILNQELDHYINTWSSQNAPSHYLRGFAIAGLLVTDDLEKAEKEARNYLRFLEEENKDPRPFPGGIALQEIQTTLYLALNEPEKAKPIIEEGIGLDESKPDILALKGIYFAQMKNESAARKIIGQLDKIKGKYDYGNPEMLKGIVEAWLGNHDTAIALLQEARNKGKSLWSYFFDGDWRLKPLFNHPDFKKNVLGPMPLPDLEITHSEPATASNNYWPIMFLLLFSGVAFYFFQHKKQDLKTANYASEPEGINDAPIEAGDAFLTKLNAIVTSNMDNVDFGLPQLCKAMGFSRAQIYRKIKELTDQSPAVYIRRLKLQRAKELLQSTDLNISEIAYEVGFKDLSYFSRSFSEEFGVSPSETRK